MALVRSDAEHFRSNCRIKIAYNHRTALWGDGEGTSSLACYHLPRVSDRSLGNSRGESLEKTTGQAYGIGKLDSSVARRATG
jgi:hypothetical protein